MYAAIEGHVAAVREQASKDGTRKFRIVTISQPPEGRFGRPVLQDVLVFNGAAIPDQGKPVKLRVRFDVRQGGTGASGRTYAAQLAVAAVE